MKSYFVLAWRNLWRNRRRTLITVSSICFALFFGLLMKSLIKGTYDRLDQEMIRSTTGYIQIQHPLYEDDKNIDNTLEWNDELNQVLNTHPQITSSVPKLNYAALASTGNLTKVAVVIGTDPELEKELSGMHKKMVEGEYFTGKPGGAMLAADLARYLQAGVGDTVVLFGQGYHGVTAAGKYWVQGIVDFNIPMMNSQMMFLSLKDAQVLFGAENRLTQVSLMIAEPNQMESIQAELNQSLDSANYAALNWQELNPDYYQTQGTKDISTGIMIGILYLIVGFGIFGTLFMMTLERRREFSVMISIGMKRSKLSIVVFIESIFLGLIGVFSGLLITLPLLLYLNANPIRLTGAMAEMYEQYNVEPRYDFSMDPGAIANQLLIIFVLCVLLSIVPIISVHRLNFVNALRGR